MGRCKICRRTDDLTKHHIKPKAAGGSNAPANLTTLCQQCHALVERFYWQRLRNEKQLEGDAYRKIMLAIRYKQVHESKLKEAQRRIKALREELVTGPRDWPELFHEACAWIKTITVTRVVRITTHNYVLEEPWWTEPA